MTTSKTVTVNERLQNDPRLQEAKRLVLEAVAEHQSELNEIRGTNPAAADSYHQTLEAFGKIRGRNLYFPYLSSGLGNGPFVELGDGSVKLDFITGIGVHGFGHSHPLLIEAGIDAAVCDTVMQGNLQQHMSSYDMANLLTTTACESGANLKHCFLTTSGAMANENSLKIAFQKKQPANRCIAFEHCFAGRTLALAQMTDKAKYRVGLPDTIPVDYIPFFEEDDPKGSTDRALAKLNEHFHRHPGKYAVLWMELIQGEGGYYVGNTEFFKALIDLAHQHNVAVIADEVQTFGRTTRPYAFQHFELDKHVDLVTIGKLSQVCATLFTEEFIPQPGLISQTFTGSSWAILSGHAILSTLIKNGHYGADGKNAKLHDKFASGIKAIAKKHPSAISGPYGIGGMVGLTPFDGSAEKAKEMVDRMYDAGLMAFMAGGGPSRVRFLMPIGCVEDKHIELACTIIESVVSEMAT